MRDKRIKRGQMCTKDVPIVTDRPLDVQHLSAQTGFNRCVRHKIQEARNRVQPNIMFCISHSCPHPHIAIITTLFCIKGHNMKSHHSDHSDENTPYFDSLSVSIAATESRSDRRHPRNTIPPRKAAISLERVSGKKKSAQDLLHTAKGEKRAYMRRVETCRRVFGRAVWCVKGLWVD